MIVEWTQCNPCVYRVLTLACSARHRGRPLKMAEPRQRAAWSNDCLESRMIWATTTLSTAFSRPCRCDNGIGARALGAVSDATARELAAAAAPALICEARLAALQCRLGPRQGRSVRESCSCLRALAKLDTCVAKALRNDARSVFLTSFIVQAQIESHQGTDNCRGALSR